MNFQSISFGKHSYNIKQRPQQSYAQSPVGNSLENDKLEISSETENTSEKSKKSRLKTALKVIGATTLSITAGWLIYKYTKGKNIKQLAGLGNKGKSVKPAQTTAQHSTAQHSTAQHSTAQHSTAQHSTAQHSTAQQQRLNDVNSSGLKNTTSAITGETAQVSQSAAAETSEISRIRAGVKGRIRTGSELTNKDIAALFEAQIMNTKPEEIEKIISSFAKEDQALIKRVLKEMTQFGNMQSLDEIAANLRESLRNKPIYRDSKNSLSQAMNYLVKNKESFGSAANASTTFTKDAKDCVMLLDEIMIQNLETNPVLRRTVEKNIGNITFISPEGWVSGINPFNQTKDMGAMAKELLAQVKTLRTQNPLLTEQQAVEAVLRKPVIDRLEKIGLGHSVEFFKNKKSIVDTSSKYFPDLVAHQLNQKALTEQEIQKILDKYHKDYHPYIRELLAHGCDVNSPKSLSLQMKKMHEKLIQLNGGTDEGIYFVVGEPYKSYSIMNMQYQLTNNIPSSKFLRKHDIVHGQNIPANAKKLVILDDIAGSGDSLTGLGGLIKNAGMGRDVIVTPMLMTENAASKFNAKALKHLAGRDISSYYKSDWFQSLSNIDKAMINKVMCGQGWGQNGCCVAFPYMSPDNNNYFFASVFAPHFTLNGAGVKNRTEHMVEQALKAAS